MPLPSTAGWRQSSKECGGLAACTAPILDAERLALSDMLHVFLVVIETSTDYATCRETSHSTIMLVDERKSRTIYYTASTRRGRERR